MWWWTPTAVLVAQGVEENGNFHWIIECWKWKREIHVCTGKKKDNVKRNDFQENMNDSSGVWPLMRAKVKRSRLRNLEFLFLFRMHNARTERENLDISRTSYTKEKKYHFSSLSSLLQAHEF